MASMLVIDPALAGVTELDCPPELDHSSSKSSSLRSSLTEISSPDATNFEDISLDDVLQGLPADAFTKTITKRPTVFVMRSSDDSLTSTLSDYSPPRKNVRPSPPQLRVVSDTGEPVPLHTIVGPDWHEPPTKRTPSPSASVYRSPHLQSRASQSRSPSPRSSHSLHSSRSSSYVPESSRWVGSQLPRNSAAVRRSSWQPGRKSVRELEDEYHDSDEEIPEDAVVWNVPISPRPANARDGSHQRLSTSAQHGRSRSPHSSRPSRGDWSNRESLGTLSPNTARMRRSVSMLSIMNGTASPSCTKTRASAMSDLSVEAQLLTEVLETYAEEKEKRQEDMVQSNTPSTRPPITKETSAVSAIELPPLRKGNVMIDPLPVSKEKEKFLTRTRPSWLPPKDPREEKRHLKEYQRMMAQSMHAEESKAKRVHAEGCARDSTRSSLARIWEQHVLPNWSAVVSEPRTRELWWRGITPRNRGVVWQKAVGNVLGTSDSTYRSALKRAEDVERRLAAKPSDFNDSDRKHSDWFAALEHDVHRAYPELRIFQPEGPLHKDLVSVLKAYAMYRPDVGYVHGLHSLAALLLLNMDASAAFVTLTNLVNRPIPVSFYTNDCAAMSQVYQLVLDAVAYKLPTLHSHLTGASLALDASVYLSSMFTSLFCNAKFGVDVASRIMDVYVFEGDKMLIRSAVGTLMKLEPCLYGSKEEILAALALGSPQEWDLGTDDEFVAIVREAGKIDHERQG